MRKIVCRLKVLMAEKDMSVAELQELSELSAYTISKYRVNKTERYEASTLLALCDALGCGIGELLSIKEIEEEEEKP